MMSYDVSSAKPGAISGMAELAAPPDGEWLQDDQDAGCRYRIAMHKVHQRTTKNIPQNGQQLTQTSNQHQATLLQRTQYIMRANEGNERMTVVPVTATHHSNIFFHRLWSRFCFRLIGGLDCGSQWIC